MKDWLSRHRNRSILVGIALLGVIVGIVVHENTEQARWHVLKKELAANARNEEAARQGAERARDRFFRLLEHENRRVRVGIPNFRARRDMLVAEASNTAVRAAIYGLTGKNGERFMNDLVPKVFELALDWDELKLARGCAVMLKDKRYVERADRAEEGFDRRDASRSLAVAAKGALDGHAYPLAHTLIDDALRESPEGMDAILVRGLLSLEEERVDPALEDANRVLGYDSSCAESHVLRARCELLRGERDSALADIARALESEPDLEAAIALRETVIGIR